MKVRRSKGKVWKGRMQGQFRRTYTHGSKIGQLQLWAGVVCPRWLRLALDTRNMMRGYQEVEVTIRPIRRGRK
jgi:hypothetical protein